MQEFIVSGDWAFERYSYTSTDTPLAGGAVVEDRGHESGATAIRRNSPGSSQFT